MPCKGASFVLPLPSSRSQIGIGGLVLDFKAAIHLCSFHFICSPKLVFLTTHSSRKSGASFLGSSKGAPPQAAVGRAKIVPPAPFSIPLSSAPLSAISVSALVASLNMADSLILHTLARATSRIGHGVGFWIRWNSSFRIAFCSKFHRFSTLTIAFLLVFQNSILD
ncbi:hypothetical protein AVEN_194276-1 [Araneus ventricosus]|uniref:Uncharacterized protein n=1 Tax=Araneus ventricosus TaxID=182803 RepID=A0A4Y2G3N2_ARAVE|nr:hypothetical protein AVEN_194276-1 [Araneus ventricosus]